jgi:homopolymeric O-antigen transport system permease protein
VLAAQGERPPAEDAGEADVGVIARTGLIGSARELLAEQIEFRELFVQMATRDLLIRYKQTAMGFGWALLMPLLNTAIFSVVFMQVAPVQTPVPYPLFAYCGLLAWNLTASSLRFSVTSLTSNTSLVTKVYFPRELFPFAAVAVSFVDTAVAAIVLAAMMLYYGVGVSATILLLPVVFAVQVAFTAALALLLSMANLFYRDVKYLFDVVLTVWMFASAVVYPLDRVRGLTGIVMRANPMTGIIEAYRSVLLYGTLPPASFWPALAATVILLPAAWLLFHRLEFQFAEHI